MFISKVSYTLTTIFLLSFASLFSNNGLSVEQGKAKALSLNITETSFEREGRIKAAAVYYIAKFTTWPKSDRNDLRFCILGSDPLNSHIEKTVRGKKVHNQDLAVTFLASNDTEHCDLVFLGKMGGKEYQLAIDSTIKSPALTISFDDSTRDGSVVHLRKHNNKLQIHRVDLKAARERNLVISSELLAVTEKVLGSKVRSKNG